MSKVELKIQRPLMEFGAGPSPGILCYTDDRKHEFFTDFDEEMMEKIFGGYNKVYWLCSIKKDEFKPIKPVRKREWA